jgi:predicted metal-dependent peptidase
MISKQRMTKMVEKWYIVEPLFFAVWTTHELCINPNIKNIRVGEGRVEYNPSFIDALDDKTLDQVLQFEVMRIVLKHPYLRRKEIQTVAYTASNITLQEYLKTKLDFPYAKQVFQTTEYDQKHFEFYYYKLLEQLEDSMMKQFGFSGASSPNNEREQNAGGQGDTNEQSDSQAGGNAQTDSQDGESNTNEANSKEQSEQEQPSETSKNQTPQEQYTDPETSGQENTHLWDANEYHSNKINDKIEAALENNAWGSVPNNIQELILATLKPKINYREVLRAFRASILSQQRVLTRMKPSRRYGFLYLGSRRDFCTKLLFAIDVSGSVSTEDVTQAFSIINQLFKYGIESVDVLQFDTKIKGKPLSMKRAKYKVKIIGRGGTAFQPVIDYIDTDTDYDGLIIFTDGYAAIPNPPKRNRRTRILWLFNNESNCERAQKNLRHIGRSTFIKEN